MTAAADLWSLALGPSAIDPSVLLAALQEQAAREPLDYRTRLLIRDGLEALSAHWGRPQLDAWIAASPVRQVFDRIRQSDLGPAGFPSLARRIMETTKPGAVLQFLRELGGSVNRPTRLEIGGSIALILAGTLSRRTEDIDVVDEVPSEIRSQHELLDRLAGRYGLHLTHFQSHYLPSDWRARLRSMGRFGQVDVFLVDVVDVFLSKLFSNREKDLDDLRALETQLDKSLIERRLVQTCGSLRGEPELAERARKNWYILFGDALPRSPPITGE